MIKLDEWLQQKQVAFMEGFYVGAQIGYYKGYIDGIENTISYIGTKASNQLREEHKGDLMAQYRKLKSDMLNN